MRKYKVPMSFVTVFATIAIYLMLASVYADELRYRAFWVAGDAVSLHTEPLSIQVFRDTGQKLAENGFILVDAETRVLDGKRLYAGLWTRGSGATFFSGPMGPIGMREARKKNAAQGLRLVDFEIFRLANGGRRYIGVWRPGRGEQILTGPMELDAFISRGEMFTNRGLRLRDVEVENINGRIVYSGLFRSGAGANIFIAPKSEGQFRVSLQSGLSQGLELIDMEQIGNKFIGVFRSGDSLAKITSPRRFGAQTELAGIQANNKLRTRDFELVHVKMPVGGGTGTGSTTPPALPKNPSYVNFTDNFNLRLEFGNVDPDTLFELTLPLDALPDWLPRDEDGTPLLPDGHCGLRIRLADSIFWQIPGDDQVTIPPFNAVPNVSNLGADGISFSGPIGSCTDKQKAWSFPAPFTSNQNHFEPLPNLRLVVQMSNGEIDFIKDTGPNPKPIDMDKLFKDETRKKLKEQVKFWNSLFKEGKDISMYCPTIGTYWKKLCSQFPDSDTACSEEVAALPDC